MPFSKPIIYQVHCEGCGRDYKASSENGQMVVQEGACYSCQTLGNEPDGEPEVWPPEAFSDTDPDIDRRFYI